MAQFPVRRVGHTQIFNVDSPTKAKAIRESAKKLGIRTVEDFFTAFAEAAENNSKLQAVTESLGTQFDKLRDRLNVALAPVGGELAKISLQISDDLVRAVERFGPIAAKVFHDNRADIIETVRALGDLLVTLGKLAFELANIGNQDAFTFIRNTIRETALMMRTLQDLAELTAAGIQFTFNSIVGGVAAAVQRALGAIGVEFETLNNLVRDTFAEAEKAFQRGQQGGINTRRLAEEFDRRDRIAAMTPEQRRAFALATADISLLASSATPTPIPTPTPPPGGGGDARQRQKTELEKATQEVNELTKKVEAFRIGEGKLFEEQRKLAVQRILAAELQKELDNRSFIAAQRALGRPLPPQLPDINPRATSRRRRWAIPPLAAPACPISSRARVRRILTLTSPM